MEKNSLSTPSNQPGTLKTFNGSLDTTLILSLLPPKYQICFGGTPKIMLKSGNQDTMKVCMSSFFGIAIFSNFNNLMRPLCKKGDRSEYPLIYNIFVIPKIYNLAKFNSAQNRDYIL